MVGAWSDDDSALPDYTYNSIIVIGGMGMRIGNENNKEHGLLHLNSALNQNIKK